MEHGIEQWSDQKVRSEVSRRRLLYTATSIAISTVGIVAIAMLGQAGLGGFGGILILLTLLANLAAVLWLFRWMSVPSKERARRRRLSVLKMLGVDETEPGASGEDTPPTD
ncbi:MAG: hypothetical protein KIT83_12915 [Bryobacterales bacterium]|nr:hypothetical protein [Bryobacterales bacterium]